MHIHQLTKETEDSGVGSRKSDLSSNIQCELSAIEKYDNLSGQSKDDYSGICSNLSKR